MIAWPQDRCSPALTVLHILSSSAVQSWPQPGANTAETIILPLKIFSLCFVFYVLLQDHGAPFSTSSTVHGACLGNAIIMEWACIGVCLPVNCTSVPSETPRCSSTTTHMHRADTHQANADLSVISKCADFPLTTWHSNTAGFRCCPAMALTHLIDRSGIKSLLTYR